MLLQVAALLPLCADFSSYASVICTRSHDAEKIRPGMGKVPGCMLLGGFYVVLKDQRLEGIEHLVSSARIGM